MQKVILTDADGVLLNWVDGFVPWMAKKGYPRIKHGTEYHFEDDFGITGKELAKYIEEFNESDGVKDLGPIKEAEKYVPMLADLGWRFHVITSMTDNMEAKSWRVDNLENLFGPHIFERYHVLGMREKKDRTLQLYTSTNFFWVEDKPSNAELGFKYGLQPILMNHDYTVNHDNPKLTRADSWKDIFMMAVEYDLSNRRYPRSIRDTQSNCEALGNR
jgi:hypothetical protein